MGFFFLYFVLKEQNKEGLKIPLLNDPYGMCGLEIAILNDRWYGDNYREPILSFGKI